MKEKVVELIEGIEKNKKKLEKIYGTLEEACKVELSLIGRNEKSAVMVAGFLENYYTCLETIFLRISQFFENNLTGKRWHELLKFRHFRRYYFELEYDWDRLDFLIRKLREAHPIVSRDLEQFRAFLQGFLCE